MCGGGKVGDKHSVSVSECGVEVYPGQKAAASYPGQPEASSWAASEEQERGRH